MYSCSDRIGGVLTSLDLLAGVVGDDPWERAHRAYDVDNEPARDDFQLIRAEFLALRYGPAWRTGERR